MTTAYRVNIGRVEDFADGAACRIDADPALAVYRIGDEFYATADRCSHEEWSLGDEGDLEGYEITCTLHMARFDVRDGRALCLPALVGVRSFPVTVVDGNVVVEIAATIDG